MKPVYLSPKYLRLYLIIPRIRFCWITGSEYCNPVYMPQVILGTILKLLHHKCIGPSVQIRKLNPFLDYTDLRTHRSFVSEYPRCPKYFSIPWYYPGITTP